jgi:hypothetical protein
MKLFVQCIQNEPDAGCGPVSPETPHLVTFKPHLDQALLEEFTWTLTPQGAAEFVEGSVYELSV